MKKIVCGILLLSLALGISGCKVMNEDTEKNGIAPAQAVDMQGKNIVELYSRKDLSSISDIDLNITHDMDGDGKDDAIHISTANENKTDAKAVLEINGVKCEDIFDNLWIEPAVGGIYLVNLNSTGDRKAIAFVEPDEDNFRQIKIYTYSNDAVTPLTINDGKKTDKYLRYNQKDYHPFDFDVNEQGDIILEQRTDSMGMWEVKKTYKLMPDNVIGIVAQDAYEVAPQSNMSSEDGGRWVVNKTITGRGIDLNKGDRIKVLSDDCNNNILIQKSTGEEGWFKIKKEDAGELYDVSEMFHMAG